MSMHLVRGMTSLNTKKRKQKGITKADRAAQERHEKFLRKMGYDPDKRTTVSKHLFDTPKPYRRETPDYPSLSDSIDGWTPRKEPQKYTGTYVKGIATMHKSNAVPVTSKEDAENISRMRR